MNKIISNSIKSWKMAPCWKVAPTLMFIWTAGIINKICIFYICWTCCSITNDAHFGERFRSADVSLCRCFMTPASGVPDVSPRKAGVHPPVHFDFSETLVCSFFPRSRWFPLVSRCPEFVELQLLFFSSLSAVLLSPQRRRLRLLLRVSAFFPFCFS